MKLFVSTMIASLVLAPRPGLTSNITTPKRLRIWLAAATAPCTRTPEGSPAGYRTDTTAAKRMSIWPNAQTRNGIWSLWGMTAVGRHRSARSISESSCRAGRSIRRLARRPAGTIFQAATWPKGSAASRIGIAIKVVRNRPSVLELVPDDTGRAG